MICSLPRCSGSWTVFYLINSQWVMDFSAHGCRDSCIGRMAAGFLAGGITGGIYGHWWTELLAGCKLTPGNKQIEKKRMEYEKIREQRRRFEAEMQKLDLQQRREEQELAAMQEDLGRIAGHQSEPTTPPEYRDAAGFPSVFSRPNRYSTSSLISPPGLLYNRPARSGSQLTSPHGSIMQSVRGFAYDDGLPARSMPGTRRNSDEDEKEEAVRQDPTSHRSTNA